MKPKFIVITIIILFISAAFLIGNKQMELIRFPERISLVKNDLYVVIDQAIDKNDLKIYWIGEADRSGEYDTLLVYDNGIIAPIPDRYGKSYLQLIYQGVAYNKIGVLKLKKWYKHDYNIRIIPSGENILIEWSVENLYESYNGIDILK